LVLGMPAESATAMAARYQYESLEFKATSHRTDGVFRPKESGLPLYFVEVQFYPLPSVYADLLVKAYSYLKQHDAGQPFCGVVLFSTKSLEPEELAPYQPLLSAGVIRRYYLDEMPKITNAPLGLAILYLIRQSESEAPNVARELVERTKKEITDAALRADLLELIETVIIYKLPKLSREEIQAMLQVHDIRETRVYQEAKEEGLKEGMEKERQRTIAKMARKNMSSGEIAEILGLDQNLVREEIEKQQS
jgi:predicted transposase/invertase (TIGR01784 family)